MNSKKKSSFDSFELTGLFSFCGGATPSLCRRACCIMRWAGGFFLLSVLSLSGCNLTAHVAARPVIDGTPVSVGVEIGR